MLKFTKALQRNVINSVTVEENFQPMVFMKNIPNLFFADDLQDENKYCREDVATMIAKAQKHLPAGLFF